VHDISDELDQFETILALIDLAPGSPDPGWIGASFEAFGDGSVELDVDGAANICL